MLKFSTLFLPSAGFNQEYSHQIETVDATGAVTFSLVSGSLPEGLTLSTTGRLSGVATTLGMSVFVLKIVDAALSERTETFQFTVMSYVDLSNLTLDQSQFVQQFQTKLAQKTSWSTGLTTQTSQTLIELVSAVGTFNTAKILRAKEDAFPETAESDSALRAIANMQGLRLSRKLPASASFTIMSSVAQTFAPFTQFSAGGYSWFNTDQITLTANVPQTHTLKEGVVKTVTLNGRGTDLQAWVSEEDSFTVSDQDVRVGINSATINKTFGGLWNYKGATACADNTLSDGRTVIQFGSRNYGAVPGTNDIVTITYVVTQGSSVNGASLVGSKITLASNSTIVASFTSNPTGGADEKQPLVYKNFSSATFGTYSSSVTKSQYQSAVNNYPGIVDAVTQAQREINPSALEWMNVIRVSALTNSPWTQAQIEEFINVMQSVTMYSPTIIWQTPVGIARDIDVDIFCFNSVPSTAAITALAENAIRKLLSPRPGILLLNLYESDLIQTIKDSAPGQISYVEVNKPTSPMIVTSPPSPRVTYTIANSGGTLVPRLYSYAISVDTPSPANDGTEDIGTPTNWVFPQVSVLNSQITLDWSEDQTQGALRYHVWGRRAGKIGKLATLLPTVTSYVDLGGPDPTVASVSGGEFLIRYNKIGTLNVRTRYAKRQSKATFPVRDVLS